MKVKTVCIFPLQEISYKIFLLQLSNSNLKRGHYKPTHQRGEGEVETAQFLMLSTYFCKWLWMHSIYIYIYIYTEHVYSLCLSPGNLECVCTSIPGFLANYNVFHNERVKKKISSNYSKRDLGWILRSKPTWRWSLNLSINKIVLTVCKIK